MNAPTRLLLALTAVAALSFAQPAKANLITNPGFETGNFAGWQLGTGTFVQAGTINGIAPHSGSRQLAASGQISQSVATTPGTTYTIDFFAAASNGFSGPVNFTLTYSFGGTVFSHLFTARTGYTEFTFNATVLGSSTNLIFARTGTGLFHLDDISVVPAGVPDGGATVSLLGCALLGLAALRRKLDC